MVGTDTGWSEWYHGQGLLQFTLQDKTLEASMILTSDLKVEVILRVDFLNTAV